MLLELGVAVSIWSGRGATGISLEGVGGHACFVYDDDNLADSSTNVIVRRADSVADFRSSSAIPPGVPFRMRFGIDRTTMSLDCEVGGVRMMLGSSSGTPGPIGIFTTRNAARVDYVVVYAY